MSCFGESKLLICRSCDQHFTLSEENFPTDLFSLLLHYDIPQIQWFCKSCNKWRVTQKDIEKLNSRVTELETNFKDMTRLLGSDRDVDDHVTPFKAKCRNTVNGNSTDSPPLRSRSPSPTSPNYSYRSDDSSSDTNKEALEIIHNIMNKEIKINRDEAQNSIKVVDAFMIELNPFLKGIDPVFKYLYCGDYKTGSSYNDLKISSANEYDINIMFILPEPFKLEVEFFKETVAFAKMKWSLKDSGLIPGSKLCILNFLDRNSDKDKYLVPLKIKSWFQSLMDKFYQSEPKIRGVKEFTTAQGGPARTIKINTDKNYVISLDLVPVFKFGFDIFPKNRIPRLHEYDLDELKKFCSFVPKTCDGEEKLLASDCKLTWRIYVPEIDKKVLYNKQCAKPIIKLLKLLRDKYDWKDLASYHLATVILWEIKNNDNPNKWAGGLLFDNFIKALESLQMYLAKEHLPYFLYPYYNLFHNLNSKQCENWSNCIHGIIKQLKSDHKKLYKVFKIPEV